MYWGVDSYNPADNAFAVPDALRRPDDREGQRITLFEFVTRRMGRPPRFWGRYLNHHDPLVRHPGGSSISEPEVRFLHGQDCRLLPVYNGSRGRAHGLTGGRSGGEQAAADAHAICERLGVPNHVIVYADAENWAGDVAWFRGWYETLTAANRRCGVYGRPIRMVENPAHPGRRYGTELRHIESRATREEAVRRIAWAQGTTGSVPRRVATQAYWGDELARAIADVTVESVLESGADPFRDLHRPPMFVWSNEPRRVMSAGRDADLDGADIPEEFVPAEPPHSAGIETTVWQYLQNALFRGSTRGSVDMNMASDRGFAGMW